MYSGAMKLYEVVGDTGGSTFTELTWAETPVEAERLVAEEWSLAGRPADTHGWVVREAPPQPQVEWGYANGGLFEDEP